MLRLCESLVYDRACPILGLPVKEKSVSYGGTTKDMADYESIDLSSTNIVFQPSTWPAKFIGDGGAFLNVVKYHRLATQPLIIWQDFPDVGHPRVFEYGAEHQNIWTTWAQRKSCDRRGASKRQRLHPAVPCIPALSS